MKLKYFIEKLTKISKTSKKMSNIEVVMADNATIVNPILKKNKVFITDKKINYK